MRMIALAACGGLVFGCAVGGANEGAPIAEGAGLTITLDELDRRVKDVLFDERAQEGPTDLYDLRAQVLDGMIEEHVLASEAARRGVELDQLFEAEAVTVTPEEVAAFFEENRHRLQGEVVLEDVEESIRTHLGARKVQEATALLVESAGIAIRLEPPRIEIAADGPSLGADDAPITIVEFSDFQCPFCQRAKPVVDELLRRYPEEVRFVYRHLPLESIHPRARAAAEASVCAEDQERFWEFHDKIFENPRAFADEDLRGHAETLGLDLAAYDACVSARTHAARVTEDLDAARNAGISGTPAFLVNGVLLTGAQPVEVFERLIQRDLKALAAAP